MEWGAIWPWLRDGFFNHSDVILRLMLAAALGGVIGLERGHSGKPAGFRTNLLICLGSALVMELSVKVGTASGGDAGRIGSNIITGIGFLGAGTIMHFRGNIIGLTTAATMWVVAAIGMAVGAQAYFEAVATTALVMLALMVLGRVEDQFIPAPTERTLELVMPPDPAAILQIEQMFQNLGITVTPLSIEKGEIAYRVVYKGRGSVKAWEQIKREFVASDLVRRVEVI
jgi:putative Mg2+ transporter-C (MgtC) family protein